MSEYHMSRCDGRPSRRQSGQRPGPRPPPAMQRKDSWMCEAGSLRLRHFAVVYRLSRLFNFFLLLLRMLHHLAKEHDVLSPSNRASYAAVSFPLCCLRLCLPRTDILCRASVAQRRRVRRHKGMRHKRSRCLFRVCVRACARVRNRRGEKFWLLFHKVEIKQLLL